jgi:hypothetical protein
MTHDFSAIYSYWHKLAQPDILPVWIGGIAALFASMAAVISLVILRGQTRAGLLSAQAAEKGAKAALLSAEAVMNAERAWIFAELGWYEAVVGRILLGSAVENGGPEYHSTTANIKITYRNGGRSPAWIDHVYGRMDITTGHASGEIYDRKECGNHGMVEPIHPGGEVSRSMELICDGHPKEKDYLNVYVIIDYHDIFGVPRETTLGYTLTLSGQLVRQNGLPGRNRNI